ncbi:Zn-dependent hydrolase [Bacillota bacterium]
MDINIKRVMTNLEKIGHIGKTSSGGITRTAFSKEYYEAVDALKHLMVQSGLEVSVDAIGNVYGKRKGRDNNLPSIVLGSHLDTVVNGGLYDGLLGIISGLEIINILNDEDVITEHPIEIAAFNSEEGNELGGTFGSRVAIGGQDLEEKGLDEKIAIYNITKDDLKASIRNMDDIYAFLELHVEQGPFLDFKGIDIGVVEGIVGIKRFKITINGESNHAGSTPMDMRKDPVLVAAELIKKANELAKQYKHPFVTTVGNVIADPGMFNVIAGNAVVYLDVRDLNENNIDDFTRDLKEYCDTFEDFDISWEMNIFKPAKYLAEKIYKKIHDISVNEGYSTTYIASGAGHDAKEFIRKIPSAMIFVPSKGGISHSPFEYTSEESIAKGIAVLYKTLVQIDNND